jgi:hypothetical protein
VRWTRRDVHRRVYRSTEWMRGLTLTGAGVTMLLLTKVLTTEGYTPNEYVVALTIVAAIAYVLLFRVAGSALIVQERGVVVRNPFGTHAIRWDDIRRFSLEQWAVFPGMGTIEVRGARPVRVFGVQAPDPRFGRFDRQTEEAIDELNRLLRDRERD